MFGARELRRFQLRVRLGKCILQMPFGSARSYARQESEMGPPMFSIRSNIIGDKICEPLGLDMVGPEYPERGRFVWHPIFRPNTEGLDRVRLDLSHQVVDDLNDTPVRTVVRLQQVQTFPGKGRFMILRLDYPLEPSFDKTWRPGEIEL
jgi:hypothetical protein